MFPRPRPQRRAVKKTAVKKTAVKKTAVKKTAVKKTAVKRAAVRKAEPNKYVLQCGAEIKSWEKKICQPTVLGKITAVAGKLGERITAKLPNRVTNPIFKAVEGAFQLLLTGAHYSIPQKRMLNRIGKCAEVELKTLEDVWLQDVAILRKAAGKAMLENNILAAIEGGGLGLGGPACIVADIPLLFTIAFRSVMEIGLTFGYDVSSVEEKKFVLSMIDLASGGATAAKVKTMLGKDSLLKYAMQTAFSRMEKLVSVKLGEITAEELAKEFIKTQGKRATQKAVEATARKVLEEVSKDGLNATLITAAREQAKRVGESLTRKKLGQLIPILGGAIGAGFNFWFVSSVSEVAYYSYLKRHLHDRYKSQ